MLPSFIEEDRKSYKMTPDSFHKAHKIIHFSISLMKYIAINSYFTLINKDSQKLKKIQKFLCENFLRPTEGQWLNFLEQLLLADSDIKKVLTKTLSEKNDSFLHELSYIFISREIKKKIIQYKIFSIK